MLQQFQLISLRRTAEGRQKGAMPRGRRTVRFAAPEQRPRWIPPGAKGHPKAARDRVAGSSSSQAPAQLGPTYTALT
eukprot:3404661-Alexandrium_andersonii.AAC.1